MSRSLIAGVRLCVNVRRSDWSFTEVPESVKVIRAEFLQEMLRAGIEVHKANKIRG